MQQVTIFIKNMVPLVFLMLGSRNLPAQSGTEPMKVTDMLQVKTLGTLTMNPDGSRYAYTVTGIISDEKNSGEYRYQSQIWVGSSIGAMPQYQFTTAPAGGIQPVWSPDGKQLAFVRAVDNTPQLFLASTLGGEPVQLTNLRYGVSNPAWSHDGKLIAFNVSIPVSAYVNDSLLNPGKNLPPYPLEKPGLQNQFALNTAAKPNADGTLEEVRAYLNKNEQEKRAKVIHKLNFQQEAVTSGELTVSHIFTIIPVPNARPKAITSGFLSYSNPRFMAGTGYLMAEAPLFTRQHPDRQQERAIYTIDTTGMQQKILLGDSGMVYASATMSPSGKWLCFEKGKTAHVHVPELYIMPMDAQAKPQRVDLDRDKSGFRWSADDRYLYFTAQSNGGVLLYKYDRTSPKPERLTSFEDGIGDFDIKGNTLVFIKNNVRHPTELFVGDADARVSKQVTSFNSWVKEKKISIPEKYTFTNTSGLEVEYWVMKPLGFEPGKKYPLLLEIHGGPTAMWGPGERSMWHEYQYFCSKGYGVVYCNPRGSGGYGEAFMRSNINDWGNGPMRDVLTALDKAVQQGWADTSKLLITGGSYAGYLVAYILGHDTRFAAACAQRGVYDLRTFFGEGNAWRLVPNYFGGYPWEKTTYDVLERESPVTYVNRIRTPLIIFHGEQDLRTGVIQSEQLYKSLKVLGREVEYVRHPGATHEITRSGNNRQRIDQMLRTWEFFERYINR